MAIDPNRAKQGRRGSQVLVVLVVALALACGAWFAVELYGELIDDAPRTAESAGAVD